MNTITMTLRDGGYWPVTEADAAIMRHLVGPEARYIPVTQWESDIAPLLPLHSLALELV